jgi:type II secretion system protein N
MKYVSALIGYLRNNKKKVFIGIVLYAVFLFLLFPFSDLGSFVTTEVAKLTQNQIYLKFEELHFSLLPTPGLELSNVKVQGVQFPQLTTDNLTIAPSIAGLLSFKPGVSVSAKGLFDGDVDITTRGGSKATSGASKQNISIGAEGIELKKLSSALGLPMSLEGKMNLDSQSVFDPSFSDQPEGDLDLKAVRVNITSANVPTPIGPLSLPDTKLQELILKGQLSKGELNIEKAQIGTPQDELFAQIRGTMNVQFQTAGGQVNVNPGPYDLTIQIKTKPSYQAKAGLFLGFLEAYKKSETPQGREYIFKVAGQNFYAPPRMTPANSF